MKNVQDFENFLDIHNISLQPQDSAYFNKLYKLNLYYTEIDEDDFLFDDAWDNFFTQISERK